MQMIFLIKKLKKLAVLIQAERGTLGPGDQDAIGGVTCTPPERDPGSPSGRDPRSSTLDIRQLRDLRVLEIPDSAGHRPAS